MNPDFDAYRLSDEHEALREAVRALAEKEIAPYAAEVDEQGRYPTEAREALVKAGFHAVTIPEEYGGEGADELAGVIVIEEVARICASSSLDPGGQRARAHADPALGLRRPEAPGPAVDRRGRADDQLRAERARGGLRRRRDAHPRPPRRRHLGAQRHQVLDHQRGGVALVHGDGGHRPGARGPTASRRSWCTPTTRASRSARRSASSASTARRPARSTSRTARSPPTGSSARRARASRPRSRRSTTPGRRSARRPSASRRARSTWRSRTSRSASSSASTSPSSRACSSCSPTWR